jgi:formate hydrogenlyase subunit 3/multisubunit Na+/H+ antiporter MnhD subunit
MTRRMLPHDFYEVPLVIALAKLLGIALGVALIYARFDRRYFDVHALFIPESPWNLSLWQFLADRANPFNFGIGTIVDDPAGNRATATFAVLIGIVAALLVAAVAVPFVFWPRAMARRAALLSLLLAAFVAYLTIYVICLILWSLYLLNFWIIALAAVMFQYYRSRAKHASRA